MKMFGTIKIYSRQQWSEVMSVSHSARSGCITRIYFRFNMKVYFVRLLESLNWGDSNEYTQHTSSI